MHFEPATLHRDFGHLQPDLLDGMRRLQTFGTHLGAVHDRATAKQAVGIVQIFQAFFGGMVATVDNEPVSLYQTRRADKLVRVPPERGTLAAAAATHDALVGAVECWRRPKTRPFLQLVLISTQN